MLILSNANPTATAKKCYFENKCFIGLNDIRRRRRTMRKKAVPRAVAATPSIKELSRATPSIKKSVKICV